MKSIDNIKQKLIIYKKILSSSDLLLKAKPRYDEYDPDADESTDDLAEGFSELNEDGEEDEAAKWLKEHDNKNKKPKEESIDLQEPNDNKEELEEDFKESNISDRNKFKEWEPREYLPHERKNIDKYIADGFTPREAERLAGHEKAHRNYSSALRSGIAPSMMSDKMHEKLKPLAAEWLQNMQRVDFGRADPAVNPIKYAAGQLAAAHQEHNKDFAKEYDAFLNSAEVKALKGRERHQKVEGWKKQWKIDNPHYEQNARAVSEKQNVFNEAKQASQERLQEILGHIMSGGVQTSVDTVSDEVGLQHLGGGKNDEGKTTGVISKDPTMNFAANNPKLLQKLSEQQKERLKHINTAKQQQGVPLTPKKPSGDI